MMVRKLLKQGCQHTRTQVVYVRLTWLDLFHLLVLVCLWRRFLDCLRLTFALTLAQQMAGHAALVIVVAFVTFGHPLAEVALCWAKF